MALRGVSPRHLSGARGAGAEGGGDTYIINIYAPNATAKDVADLVERRLSTKLSRSGSLATITSGGKVAF